MDPHSSDFTPGAAKPPAPLPLRFSFLISILTFLIGLGGGYLLWGRSPTGEGRADGKSAAQTEDQMAALIRGINPRAGYTLPVSYADLGPQLLAAGAIDYALFLRIYEQKGLPLTEAQQAILTAGSRDAIVLNRQDANFLLNFFWAVGLVNQNPILLDGPMLKYGEGEIGRFASTGGWTIGVKDPVELYASQPLIPLTAGQQARLEKVAAQVYRPCCNNPTHFPDCNHGMAMLGLLSLLASEDVSEAEMFAAAKYANAFWFPQQTLELAVFFQSSQDMAYSAVDPQIAVGQNFSSGQGYQNVHSWLAEQGLLDPAPTSGGSCGV